MKKVSPFTLLFAVSLVLLSVTGVASAAGTSWPWDGALTQLANSLTGPVAGSVCLIGIVAGGMGAIWGSEFGYLFRTLCVVILVAATIMGAKPILGMLGFTQGAEVKRQHVLKVR